MQIALFVILIAAQRDLSLPDASQFARLYLAANEPLRDFEFVYEGERWNEPAGKHNRQAWFQGCYAHSRAGDSHLELYVHNYRNGVGDLSRSTLSLIGRDLLERSQVPAASSGSGMPSHSPGMPGVLNRPFSPEQLLYYGWFLESVIDPDDQGFEALGHEEVDGRSCLVVRLDRTPGLKGRATRHFLFWIDTERNWQPLRVEWRDERARPTLVVRRIQLEEIDLAGAETFWFPIEGDVEHYFQPENGDPPRVVAFSHAYIVRDSLQLNPGFPKERFSIDYSLNSAADPLVQARREFAKAASQPVRETRPAPRTNPEAVRARVEKGLKEAEQAGTLVEATSPSKRWWTGPRILQVVILSVAVMTLACAMILLRRGR